MTLNDKMRTRMNFDVPGSFRTKIQSRGNIAKPGDTRNKLHSIVSARTRMVGIEYNNYIDPLTKVREVAGARKSRTVDVNFSNPTYPSSRVREVIGERIRKVKINFTNPPDPRNIIQDVVGKRTRKDKVSFTNSTEPRINIHEVVGARMRKDRVSSTSPTSPPNKVQKVDGVRTRKVDTNLTNPTEPLNKYQTDVVRMRKDWLSFINPNDHCKTVQEVSTAMRKDKVSSTSPTNTLNKVQKIEDAGKDFAHLIHIDPHNSVQEVVCVRLREDKVSSTSPTLPPNNVQRVDGARTKKAEANLTNPNDCLNKVQKINGTRLRKDKVRLTNLTDPLNKVRTVVGVITGKVDVNVTCATDPLNNTQKVVGGRKKSRDGEKLQKDKICSSVSYEERIFEMSSSANTNKDDFKKKYSQLFVIGEGGFGVVFTGFRTRDFSQVVIKYIPMKHVMWEKVTCSGKEFKVILEVALMLKAAGLPGSDGKSSAVSLLDWYLLDNHLVLVMERPPRCMNLKQYLRSRGGSLPEFEAKIILKQLVDAAIDMHSKGVFHRDIKSENILLQFDSGQPRVRIIDFGCGCFLSHTPYHSFSGTRKYYPPEWFSDRTYWAHFTTVWQLGALFYSMLNGEFSTRKFVDNKLQISSTLSTEVQSMLEMCLNIKPYERATLMELHRHTMFTKLNHPSTQL